MTRKLKSSEINFDLNVGINDIWSFCSHLKFGIWPNRNTGFGIRRTQAILLVKLKMLLPSTRGLFYFVNQKFNFDVAEVILRVGDCGNLPFSEKTVLQKKQTCLVRECEDHAPKL